MLTVAEIAAMTAGEQADLVAKGAARFYQGQYEASLALAELARSEEFRESGYQSVEALAAARTSLEPEEVTELLRIGETLLELPELHEAFRSGGLSWPTVKELVPRVTEANVADLIAKARETGSNAPEPAAPEVIWDPITGEKMVQLHLSPEGRQRFDDLVAQMRAVPGNENLSEQDCLLRMLQEVQAGRERVRRNPRP